TENAGLIRACRQLNRSTEVFDNSTLGPVANRIGTLGVGTQVTLTGATSPGRAQVFLSGGSLSSVQPVGWLNAGTLAPCGNTPPPVSSACFRADQALVVRSGPSTGATVVAGFNANDLVRATTNPPTQQTSSGDGRRWMQVSIFNGSSGWIARTGVNGVGSNVTPTNCP
ncbi:MAG TPA: SH3 domain-containing protein, partial [Nodosilinea sp.]|nr:SH3 domain-containing protein [Nodosilinea sp.]